MREGIGMDVICIDANGNVDTDMMEMWDEYDRLNAESLANSGFAVGDRVRLNSSCPKDSRDMCRVRVGDIGTLLGVSSWPVNDTNGERVVVQAEVRWDHEEKDDILPLGIFIEHLDNLAPAPKVPSTNRRGAIAAQKARKKND